MRGSACAASWESMVQRGKTVRSTCVVAAAQLSRKEQNWDMRGSDDKLRRKRRRGSSGSACAVPSLLRTPCPEEHVRTRIVSKDYNHELKLDIVVIFVLWQPSACWRLLRSARGVDLCKSTWIATCSLDCMYTCSAWPLRLAQFE